QTLWAGTADGAVWRVMDGKLVAAFHLMTERVVAIAECDDAIWFASLGTGAVRVNRNAQNDVERITRANGLLGDTLWNLFVDREGDIWFAQNGGASRLRRDYAAFEAYTGEQHGSAAPALPDPSTFAALPRGAGIG